MNGLFQTVKSWFTGNHPDTFNEDMSEAELDQAIKEFKPVAQAEVQQAAAQASQDVSGLQSTVTALQETVNQLTANIKQSQEANASQATTLAERVEAAEKAATTATASVKGIEASVKEISKGVTQLLAGSSIAALPTANETLLKDEAPLETKETVVKVGSLDNLLFPDKK